MKIVMKDTTVGPHHDPYGATEVIVTTDTGSVVSHYSSGLGTNRVTVDGKELHESHDDTVLHRRAARELFAENAGITLDAAIEQYELEYEADPMGEPGMYV